MISLAPEIRGKARLIKLVMTDCDGVLSDGGVYYSEKGEQLKRFHIRDGMGVERLRDLTGIETGIISGEKSPAIKKRAEKLSIEECHLGIKDKERVLRGLADRRGLNLNGIAYIGDDVNDLGALSVAGLSACPNDAVIEVKKLANIVCDCKGGQGAFREFAEIIIIANISQ